MFFGNLTKLLKSTSISVFPKSLASNPAVEKNFPDRVIKGTCCVRWKSTHSLTCLLWKFFLSKFMLSLFVEINLHLKAELNYFSCQHCRNDRRRFRIMKLIISRGFVLPLRKGGQVTGAEHKLLVYAWNHGNEIKVKPLFQLRLFNSKVPWRCYSPKSSIDNYFLQTKIATEQQLIRRLESYSRRFDTETVKKCDFYFRHTVIAIYQTTDCSY